MAFVNSEWDELMEDDSPIGISSAMKESILDDEFEQEKKQMTEPKTNRDVINAMSDEELAKWKESCPVELDDKNGYCRIFWLDARPCHIELNCRQCLTEWLKAPAGKHQEVE